MFLNVTINRSTDLSTGAPLLRGYDPVDRRIDHGRFDIFGELQDFTRLR